MTDPSSPVPPAFPPDHPRATTVFVLGILGLVMCQVCAPIAWLWGSRALAEIDARPDLYGGRSLTNAGMVMGLIGTIILGLMVLFLIGLGAIGLMAGLSAASA